MQISQVPSLPPEAREADFSFDIDSEIVAPFDSLPFRVVPLPLRRKAYGFDDGLFEARDGADAALFVASEAGTIAGYIAISRGWNGCAEIEDIAVARPFRRRGLAGTLMKKAVLWAEAAGLNTIRLETQSNNVAACHFYRRFGFVLGGYDGYLYCRMGPDVSGDVALFWYLHRRP